MHTRASVFSSILNRLINNKIREGLAWLALWQGLETTNQTLSRIYYIFQYMEAGGGEDCVCFSQLFVCLPSPEKKTKRGSATQARILAFFHVGKYSWE